MRTREPRKAAATEGAARVSPGAAGAPPAAPSVPAGMAPGAGSEAAARGAEASAMLAAMSPQEARPAGPPPACGADSREVLGLGGARQGGRGVRLGFTPKRPHAADRGGARGGGGAPDAGTARGGAGSQAGAARAAGAAGVPRGAPGAAAWSAGAAQPGAAAGQDGGGRERGALAPRVRFALDGRAAGLAPAGGAGGEDVVLRDPLRCGPPTGPSALAAGGPSRAEPGPRRAAWPSSGQLIGAAHACVH